MDPQGYALCALATFVAPSGLTGHWLEDPGATRCALRNLAIFCRPFGAGGPLGHRLYLGLARSCSANLGHCKQKKKVTKKRTLSESPASSRGSTTYLHRRRLVKSSSISTYGA